MRFGRKERSTQETTIRSEIILDGGGTSDVTTGIGFLDHMLDQLARHSNMDIILKAEGDLHIDPHHTVEDCAIVLGQAFTEALGDRKGINRFAQAHIPLDEALTRVVVDLSNRPYLVWKVQFTRERLGTLDCEMIEHWFHSFAQAGGITLHVENLYGVNNHHIAESCFKGLARALREAVRLDATQQNTVPSTKGLL